MKLISWIKDKIEWLKTFNNRPIVSINGDIIGGTDDTPPLEITGRVHVNIHGVISGRAPAILIEKGAELYVHGDIVTSSKPPKGFLDDMENLKNL